MLNVHFSQRMLQSNNGHKSWHFSSYYFSSSTFSTTNIAKKMVNLHFVVIDHICMDVTISSNQISIYRHAWVVQYLNIVSRRRHSGFSVPISPISPCISLYHSVALVSIFLPAATIWFMNLLKQKNFSIFPHIII